MNKERDDTERSPLPVAEKQHGTIEFSRSPTVLGRFVDSFKRNPNARVTTEAIDAEGRPLPNQPPAEPALAMKLKNRHLQMIAIGGSIGMCPRLSTLKVLILRRNRSVCGVRIRPCQRRSS